MELRFLPGNSKSLYLAYSNVFFCFSYLYPYITEGKNNSCEHKMKQELAENKRNEIPFSPKVQNGKHHASNRETVAKEQICE